MICVDAAFKTEVNGYVCVEVCQLFLKLELKERVRVIVLNFLRALALVTFGCGCPEAKSTVSFVG